MLVTVQKENIFRRFAAFMRSAPAPVKCSMCLMGLGQLLYRQWIKGIIYLGVLAGAIVYLVLVGFGDIKGFFTLGEVVPNPWANIAGDDSVKLMLGGLLAFLLLAFLVLAYISNIRDAAFTAKWVAEGKKPKSFLQSVRSVFDEKFYMTALFLPIAGIVIFNILPILLMICIAFTNYGSAAKPPDLLSWVGMGSFLKIFALKEIASTFLKILVWNIAWAVVSTALIYFGGIFLSLLLNKKCVKGKRFWRVFPILAYATPGFIMLIGFQYMFLQNGPVNYYLQSLFDLKVDFLGAGGKWWARGIGLFVICWMSIPTQMLLMTGLLSNLNQDLYEAAQIDGANRFVQFTKITLPFLIFSTTPMLITSFVGNFNNFGIFYFLRGKVGQVPGYFNANETDLVINWLYRLTVDAKEFAIGAALSIIIFIITSVISLIIYMRSSAYKKEDTFK